MFLAHTRIDRHLHIGERGTYIPLFVVKKGLVPLLSFCGEELMVSFLEEDKMGVKGDGNHDIII